MFRHVLVGVDGGNGGRDAVALAQRLVDPDGRVTLGHVHGGILSRLPTVTLWNEGQVEDAESVLRAEQRAAGGVVEVGVASIGAHSPGEGLHRLAERTGADLLVIGVSHHRAAGRALIGDNARSVLNGAPCAVAVAPHDYREHPDPIARIGVGYDGSPESGAALAVARTLAERTGAEIEALDAAYVPAMIAPGPWGDVVSAVREDAERRVHALPDVHPTVAEGSPIPALLELGTRSDLLVLGSRGYGPVRQLVQGTTSGYVQRHAECPVIVVPRPEATAEDADAAGSDRVETVG